MVFDFVNIRFFDRITGYNICRLFPEQPYKLQVFAVFVAEGLKPPHLTDPNTKLNFHITILADKPMELET
jgi:hypothetical protein